LDDSVKIPEDIRCSIKNIAKNVPRSNKEKISINKKASNINKNARLSEYIHVGHKNWNMVINMMIGI